MKANLRTVAYVCIGLGALSAGALAAESSKADATKEAKEAKEEQKAAPAANLTLLESRLSGIVEESSITARDREVLGWANVLVADVQKTLDGWVDSHAITEDKLFASLYYPQHNTNPIKYSTDWDSLADRDIGPLEERFLAKSVGLAYVILSDVNGYVPTHNQKYSQPLTGNHAVDLVNNRTKRIFMNTVGFRAARSDAPFLLQMYERDTGERMFDLSVPVRVKGKHWGAIRFGYTPGES